MATQEQAGEFVPVTELLARERQLWVRFTVARARWRESVATYAEMWCRAMATDSLAESERLARAAWAVDDWAQDWKRCKEAAFREWCLASAAVSAAICRERDESPVAKSNGS